METGFILPFFLLVQNTFNQRTYFSLKFMSIMLKELRLYSGNYSKVIWLHVLFSTYLLNQNFVCIYDSP